MWHQIEQSISEYTQKPFSIKQKHLVAGGDISQAFQISNARQSYFVKVNDLNFVDNFNAEAIALQSLALTQTINTPNFIEVGTSKAYSYLILEFINFSAPSDISWYQAGTQLAYLHKASSQPMFGFDDNNFIGKTPQFNRWQSNWSTFFAEQRIGFQLELLAEQDIRFGDIDEIVGIIHNLLKPRKLNASLLHGDLWRGNLGFSHDQVYLYDPACYYGDYETDLAMTELFGAFPAAFYQGYYKVTPQESGYSTRREIYNLYHILNHANLFGGSYIEQAKQHILSLSEL
ncbi:fructosamine kinase family protein [Catenovulum sp. 2E275]|uniref:fructosamine kinase family protein n=1 Tax=Catenovulum sp. 2E275 TaxID=2980497 RepID=UPI0021D14873|nr:fructosamine kinase family protein [Catenovulum sp. 2E275]MCU4676492.1 fructosamine kinase family protein [Catenovulum sp. 2E275]